MTGGWVNDDIIFIFRWTSPLISPTSLCPKSIVSLWRVWWHVSKVEKCTEEYIIRWKQKSCSCEERDLVIPQPMMAQRQSWMARMSPGHGTKLRLIPCFDETTERSAYTCARMSIQWRLDGAQLHCCRVISRESAACYKCATENADELREVLRWTRWKKEKWRDGSITWAQEQRCNKSTMLEERMTIDASATEDVCGGISFWFRLSGYAIYTVSHSLFFKFPKGNMEARIITNFCVFCGVVAEIIYCDVLDLVVRVVNLTQGTRQYHWNRQIYCLLRCFLHQPFLGW